MMEDLLTNPRSYTSKDLLDLAEIDSAPVDLDKIVRTLGVKVSDDFDFDKIALSGKICWSDDRSTAEIWINPTDSDRRQRFTLSHELGHLFRHMLPAYANDEKDESFTDITKHFHRDGSVSNVEREANRFAAGLLMPSKLLRAEVDSLADEHRLENGKIGMSRDDFIAELADRFEVSTQAMKYRLMNLGILR